MRHVLVLALVALPLVGAGGSALWADEPTARAPAPGPTTVEDLEKALQEEAARLAELIQLAARDPRFRDVETYKGYTIEEFSDSRRKPKADDILDIMADKDAPIDLRKEAFGALTDKSKAMAFDPDLQGVRGQTKPRNEWCRRNVIKLLYDKDEDTRRFAHELLVAYFPGHRNDSDVIAYDPKEGTKTQWKKTATHWSRVLKR